MLVVSSMDMIQGSLSGVIKALNLQKFAMWINCVTYYIIVLPLAVYFTFFYKSSSSSSLERGIGLRGIYLAMFFGMIHQITAYLLLIKYSDWQRVIYETEDRQEKENEKEDSVVYEV